MKFQDLGNTDFRAVITKSNEKLQPCVKNILDKETICMTNIDVYVFLEVL